MINKAGINKKRSSFFALKISRENRHDCSSILGKILFCFVGNAHRSEDIAGFGPTVFVRRDVAATSLRSLSGIKKPQLFR